MFFKGFDELLLSQEPIPDGDLLKCVINSYSQAIDSTFLIDLAKPFCHLNAEAIKHFQIGYADESFGASIPQSISSSHSLLLQLQKIGLLDEKRKERFSKAIVVPIFNKQKLPVQINGWKTTRTLPLDFHRHVSLKLYDRDVWNYMGLVNQKEWIFCHFIWDALTLWTLGYQNVTYGFDGFENAHLELLDQVRPQKVILCFNNDSVGNYYANECLNTLKDKNIAAARVEFSKGTGIQRVMKEHSKPKNSLCALVKLLELS